ncbi:MAG: ORF6N domain-containing protein [Deltaproteobacteria bacterium]|nr:ORF6N domain-containing protein [Deltaproteobacteria bacterium]
MYGVPTKRLNEQIKRNKKRFPCDFMFKINGQEWEILKSRFTLSNVPMRSQFATGSQRHRDHRLRGRVVQPTIKKKCLSEFRKGIRLEMLSPGLLSTSSYSPG